MSSEHERRPCCPACKEPIPEEIMREFFAARGGAAGRGKAKARDPEKMRAAALKRWGKR